MLKSRKGKMNALRILRTLDRHLKQPIAITLYGRAALALGFPDAPEGVARSLDVDLITSKLESDILGDKPDFWEALETANVELASESLYLTHIFREDQVILLPNWHSTRIPLTLPLQKLAVSRLDNLNLVLSKMMRDDADDLADARFLLEQSSFTAEQLQGAFKSARVPPITDPNLEEIFERVQPKVLAIARELEIQRGL